jgi:hypothetical protein
MLDRLPSLHASAIWRNLLRKPLTSGNGTKVAVVVAADADVVTMVEATMVDEDKHLVAMTSIHSQKR